MDDPNANFPDETYIEGLRTADDNTLAVLYNEFHRPVVRAITGLGGSSAAGNVFFQTAVVEAARQARAGEIPENIPFFYHIKALALAHFLDWLAERGQEMPAYTPDPDEPDLSAAMPDVEQMRETRRAILYWRRPADSEAPVLEDPEGKIIFQKLQQIERQHDVGSSASKGTRGANRILTYAVVGLIFALLGYFLYLRFSRAQTPAEVYGSNFNPPKSIVDDIRARQSADMGNDSTGARPNVCDQMLAEADEFYKNKEYKAAASRLSDILDDSLSVCHSDALFYLGIIGLQLDEPGATLQCFSKIDDLERYGEDLYWYQALAFVKLAAKNPALRDKAAGAVERAVSNTQDPQRRVQAEAMLKQLAQ